MHYAHQFQHKNFIFHYSEFNLNQYSVASSLMYSLYTAVAVALS
ncbi:hypothetical protein [Alysiella crassa]|nr:hypothetical protein [Alysiella crassa]